METEAADDASDEEVPEGIDLRDPYFKEEFNKMDEEARDTTAKEKKKKKKRRKEKYQSKDDTEVDPQEKVTEKIIPLQITMQH